MKKELIEFGSLLVDQSISACSVHFLTHTNWEQLETPYNHLLEETLLDEVRLFHKEQLANNDKLHDNSLALISVLNGVLIASSQKALIKLVCELNLNLIKKKGKATLKKMGGEEFEGGSYNFPSFFGVYLKEKNVTPGQQAYLFQKC